ncbi:MAG: sigma-54-dependent Fis family transcriptional regulator [Fibrobacter sp.]|nr:sigma-54-dependent Fis family transcriptional regulator [Fibrobacter sp.]
MAKTRILFLSEENESISFLEDVLSSVNGYETRLCAEAEKAVDAFRHFSPEITVVNLDRDFSDSLLHTLRDISPAARFLGFGIHVANLPKSRSEIFNTLLSRDALRLRFMTEVSMLKQQSDLLSQINAALKKIVGKSPQVKALYDSIFKAIRSKGATVLIQGESGVGKELVAKAIASVSNHLISVNCSAISENLFESELFGHARGAFTGAITERKGLFEAANGGVLYLDEVGDIPLAMQAKLLRALQEGEIRPVGSSETKKVKVQIVAATNHDLQKESEKGTFRKDLFYRLNVIPIYVPTLRERKEDIPELVEHFIQEFALFPDFKPEISPETMQALIRYDWPGNIRELENAIHRAIVLMNGNELTIENIFPAKENLSKVPQVAHRDWTGIHYAEFQELQKQEERDYIIAKIHENDGSIKKTAESFGMQRPALYARAARIGLDLKTLH